MMGTWVEFTAQMGGDQSKQRSYVKFIEGTYTTVFDEHSFAEVCKGAYREGLTHMHHSSRSRLVTWRSVGPKPLRSPRTT